MKVPHTYAEWVQCFDLLQSQENDEAVLAAMEQGTLEWTLGVAERFIIRIYNLFDERLKQSSSLLSRDFQNVRGDEFSFVNCLLGARRRLNFLMRIANLPCLPEEYRRQLTEIIVTHAKNAQQSLEQSATVRDRSGRLSYLIRNNALTNLSIPTPLATQENQTVEIHNEVENKTKSTRKGIKSWLTSLLARKI